MNSFEFLGLPANHRPKNKVVQLVKHYNEVPASKKSFPLIGQAKKDGVYGMIVVRADGVIGCFGRTGEQFTFTERLIADCLASWLPVGVYIGEILSNYKCSLEQLSGVINPNRVNELDDEQFNIAVNLKIALHDYITLPEFIDGKSSRHYESRYSHLRQQVESSIFEVDIIPVVKVYDESSKNKFTAACLAAGEEGAVYKQPSEGWVAGHKGYRQMKEVGEVSYDLECIGYEEGEGKYSCKVANLVFKWRDGETIKAMLGKGWSHEDAELMFNSIRMYSGDVLSADNLYPIGKVYKVKGLMDSSKGKIRLPKVAEVRIDKTKGDF